MTPLGPFLRALGRRGGRGTAADAPADEGSADDPAEVALEIFREGIEPDREHEVRLARTRWLERHGSVASFPCGLVELPEGPLTEPDPWGERVVSPVPATVAVTASDLVVLREGIEEIEPDLVVEVVRFPRASFVSAHLEDEAGTPVAAPAGDVVEPSRICRLVVRWRTDAGGEDERAFLYRSLVVAEEAAARFRRFGATA
ncbi:MAG TPA: hypothetical protein VF044_07490 [Actinomycetota bacterium]